MQRNSSAAEGRLDPRELVARIAAEHGSPMVPAGRDGHPGRTGRTRTTSTGRHRRAATLEPPSESATGAHRAAATRLNGLVTDTAPVPVVPRPRTRAASTGPAEGPDPVDGPAGGLDRFTEQDAPWPGYLDASGSVSSPSSAFPSPVDATALDGPASVTRVQVDTDAALPAVTGRLLTHDFAAVAEPATGPVPVVEAGRGPEDPADDETADEATQAAPAHDEADESRVDQDGPAAAEAGGATAVRGRRRRAHRARRSLLRRIAPPAAGAAAILVAAMVAVLIRPSDEGPEFTANLVSSDGGQAAPPTGASSATTSQTGTPTVDAPPALADAARAAREHATTSAAAATSNTGAAGPTSRTGGATAGGRAQVSAGDGVTAAASRGWKYIGGDEFDGSMSPNWGAYDGAGHGGNGRRSPDAVSVRGGALVIRGDSNGTTGGVAWNDGGRRFGKWEMRARFPKGDEQYHPVLILWPSDRDWPEGGEIDFAETTSASSDVSFFLHYSASNQQKSAKRSIDITQWHNYAVEWTANGIVGYIDGQQWFSTTDSSTLPPGKMHATIQLDYFPDGGSPAPSELQVDWMRMYS